MSKSLLLKSNTSHTDAACVSVQNTTTPTGTPQKDPLHVQVVSSTTSGALKSSSSVSIVSLSSSPDKFNNIDLEDLLANADHDKILSVINSIKYVSTRFFTTALLALMSLGRYKDTRCY